MLKILFIKTRVFIWDCFFEKYEEKEENPNFFRRPVQAIQSGRLK